MCDALVAGIITVKMSMIVFRNGFLDSIDLHNQFQCNILFCLGKKGHRLTSFHLRNLLLVEIEYKLFMLKDKASNEYVEIQTANLAAGHLMTYHDEALYSSVYSISFKVESCGWSQPLILAATTTRKTTAVDLGMEYCLRLA
jgi:hypothetical protein